VKQVTELDEDSTAQGRPVYIHLAPSCKTYPGSQLRLPSFTLTLKALPHAVPQLCLCIFGTGTLIVSFKDFLVAEIVGKESIVFKL
jgi:hypothetical protein